jgi:transposase-like protein
METSRATVPVIELAPVPEVEAKRQRRSVQERRQIVEEALVPEASAARLVRAHGAKPSWRVWLFHDYRRPRERLRLQSQTPGDGATIDSKSGTALKTQETAGG